MVSALAKKANNVYLNQLTPKQVGRDGEEKFKSKDSAFVKTSSLEEELIKRKIEEMKAWQAHVKKHELDHMIAGGGNISSAGYIYAYGPDGHKYIVGGSVSVTVPGGLSHESIDKLARLERAAMAASDHSQQDLMSANMISAIKRSRMMKLSLKKAIDSYEKNTTEKSTEALKDGTEIFAYKKMNISSTRLLELFV